MKDEEPFVEEEEEEREQRIIRAMVCSRAALGSTA